MDVKACELSCCVISEDLYICNVSVFTLEFFFLKFFACITYTHLKIKKSLLCILNIHSRIRGSIFILKE